MISKMKLKSRNDVEIKLGNEKNRTEPSRFFSFSFSDSSLSLSLSLSPSLDKRVHGRKKQGGGVSQ
jgi:hypothetical protein